MAKVPARSQVLVPDQSTASELQIVEVHPHLMQEKHEMMARGLGLCDVSMDHFLTFLVASWSKTAITLSKHMIIAHCTATPDFLGLRYFRVLLWIKLNCTGRLRSKSENCRDNTQWSNNALVTKRSAGMLKFCSTRSILNRAAVSGNDGEVPVHVRWPFGTDLCGEASLCFDFT